VMSFEHEGLAFNLLDTPGHKVSARTPSIPIEHMNNHVVAIIA